MTVRRTILLGVLLCAVVLAAIVALFRVEIGTALFRRGVADRIGRDATVGLPDGLHVVLCGTGSPLPDPARAGSCTLIIAGRHMVLIDAGEGSTRSLARMTLPAARIEAVFLTHFHSDHIDGLGPVMLMRWTGKPWTTPLPIHGPTGVDGAVAGFNAAYAADARARVAHHGDRLVPASGAGGTALSFAVPASGSVVVDDRDGVRISAFAVDHGPVHPAVGYRVDYKGRSVVISGDTRAGSGLVAAALGADLMVHEALQPALVAPITAALMVAGQANTAQITRDIIGYLSTPAGAADDARGGGVRALVLSHLVPPLPSRLFYPAFLSDAAKHFAGPITVGEDGMMFSMVPGSTTVTVRRLP